MNKIRNIKLALKAALFCSILTLMFIISYNYHKACIGGVIYTDMEGYYMYLPAVFIYHGFENVPVKTKLQFPVYKDTKKVFTKYTCGVALMQAPFFLINHAILLSFNKSKADGYSLGYSLSVIFAACFYSLAACWLLVYMLNRRYPLLYSILTSVILFGATNLYYYTICQPGMSHVYSLFLFTLIVYLTPGILQSNSFKNWIVYGLIFGLIILIRPTNTLLILYPIFYNCYTLSAIRARLLFFIEHAKFIASGILSGILLFIPQLVYWKYISGSFIIYSYSQEGFIYWTNPRILKVLFDVQNGWLLYSPVMLLALWGLFINFRKRSEEALPTVMMLVIATYIFASWWAWWFGGAFGHRCYVEYYSLLSFGIVAALFYARENRTLMILTTLFVLASIYWNLSLTYIYSGTAPWDGPTWTWLSFADVLRKLI